MDFKKGSRVGEIERWMQKERNEWALRKVKRKNGSKKIKMGMWIGGIKRNERKKLKDGKQEKL